MALIARKSITRPPNYTQAEASVSSNTLLIKPVLYYVPPGEHTAHIAVRLTRVTLVDDNTLLGVITTAKPSVNRSGTVTLTLQYRPNFEVIPLVIY